MPNEREAIASMGDAEMQNADAMTENFRESEDALAAKLKELTGNPNLRIQRSLERHPSSTNQLRALRRSQLEEVLPVENVGSTCRKLHFYSLPQTKNGFLQLHSQPSKFYVRDGYKELYDAVCKEWEGNHYRVCLIGNAGTGKSMFQLFVLKQLLQQPEHERKYDLVVRQVDSRIYIIDLKHAEVFRWRIDAGDLTDLLGDLKKTLYFFEPGNDAERPPLGVFTPSLSTLSPYERRIKEYSKSLMKALYFWPWSFSEMWAVVLHSQLSIDFDEFVERYKLFGGIIQNVLGQDHRAKEKLESRLQTIDFDILTKKALNVDREDSSGATVSGFLVCYNHRWNEGNNDFSKKNLEYTSLAVEDEVLNKLRVRTADEHVKGVLRRLNGEMIDLSGKMLENAAMELFSCGTTYKWQTCAVGEGSWRGFRFAQKTIRRTFTIGQRCTQENLIIAPMNCNFPAVNFLFSCQKEQQPVVAFQCTWDKTHPLTVRALYEFRCEQMQIPDTQIVNIYLISPDKETLYQSKTKSQFLDGSLAVDLQWTQTKTVRTNRLQTMWNSTNIHVLRPKKSWKETLTEYSGEPNRNLNET